MEPLAQSIQSDHLISEVMIGNTEHKIGLYADDVLLSLTNPLTSLPALKDKLNCFSRVSLYKTNHSNS